MFSRFVVLLAMTTWLSGCDVSGCFGSANLPKPEPLPGRHALRLSYGELPSVSMNLECERFYDAQCSERGNYWSVREVGSSGAGDVHQIRFIVVNDPKLGRVELQRPSCEVYNGALPKSLRYQWYEKSWAHQFGLFAKVNGASYHYAGESAAGHVYRLDPFPSARSYDAKARESVTLPFTMQVDGATLGPPAPKY